MMNPLLLYREETHTTQQELANHLQITRQVITNLERGLLSSLPAELSAYTHIPQSTYTDWVTSQRNQNTPQFHTPELQNQIYNSPLPPNYKQNKDRWFDFKYLVRPDMSHRGFCRLLVYQPSLLSLYESKNQCKPSLIQALREVGLTTHEISQTGIVIP